MDSPLFTHHRPSSGQPSAWSLALSLGLHGMALFLLSAGSLFLRDWQSPLESTLEESIQLNQRNRRLVWYRLPPLPEVRNSLPQTTAQKARGERLSPDEIVVERKHNTSTKQLIHRPNPDKILRAEVDAPNLVVQNAPPAPPRKAVLPPAPQRAPAPTPEWSEAPPSLPQSETALPASPINRQVPKLARRFAPPSTPRPAGSPARSLDFDSPALDNNAPASGVESALANAQLLASGIGDLPRLAKPAPRTFRPPAASAAAGAASGNPASQTWEAPPQWNANAGSAGLGKTELAVLSPSPGKGLPPPGAALDANFSQARELGPPTHVDNRKAGAATIAGVSTNPRPRSPLGAKDFRLLTPQDLLAGENPDEFFEIRTNLAQQWPRLSAPMAPSNRLLPRRIEPFFRLRRVFTVVIPIDKMDRYAGDWILWFAEKDPGSAQGNTHVSAPLPYWKLESKRSLIPAQEAVSVQRVLIHLDISTDGRLAVRQILTRLGPETDAIAMNDLSRWVFSPAKRDGQPIPVEAIVEIPFRFPPHLAHTNP